MRILGFLVLSLFLTVWAASVSGCYMRTRNGELVGVGVAVTTVRDDRWYYDNHYDDRWRRNHPYRKGYRYHYR